SLISIVSINKNIPYHSHGCFPLLPIIVSVNDVPLRAYVRTDRKDDIGVRQNIPSHQSLCST
ncbi:hypothetical protein N322_02131, partial [Cariama cristata]